MQVPLHSVPRTITCIIPVRLSSFLLFVAPPELHVIFLFSFFILRKLDYSPAGIANLLQGCGGGRGEARGLLGLNVVFLASSGLSAPYGVHSCSYEYVGA